VLDTHVTNAEARSLYQTLGYRELGVILLKEM
jgi:predicted GNAT family acetyltransferase